MSTVFVCTGKNHPTHSLLVPGVEQVVLIGRTISSDLLGEIFKRSPGVKVLRISTGLILPAKIFYQRCRERNVEVHQYHSSPPSFVRPADPVQLVRAFGLSGLPQGMPPENLPYLFALLIVRRAGLLHHFNSTQSDLQRDVLELRYGLVGSELRFRSHSEIGRMLNISHQQALLLEMSAIKFLWILYNCVSFC